MSDSMPVEVVVTDLGDGVRYRLPRRKPGRFRSQGAIHLAGSLCMGIPFMSFWLWAVGCNIDWQDLLRPENGLLLLFLAFGSWMFLMAVGTGGRGLFLFAGHSEIELRGDVLRGIERLGWLRWSWRRPVAGLRRFDVRDAMMEQGSVRVYESAAAAAEYNTIVPVWETEASTKEAKRRQLAPGYPRAWLLPLANDLVQRCQLRASKRAAMLRAITPIAVTEEPLPNSAGFLELLEQPGRSRVVAVKTPEALTVTLPSGWLGRGGAVLAVADDQLAVMCRKLFGRDRRQWSRQQLADIRVGCIHDSEGPDTAELQIQPHPGEGKSVRLRLKDEGEARWLATLLRRALRLEETRPGGQARSFLERNDQPAGSRIVRHDSDGGVTLNVPAMGFRHSDVRSRLLSCLILLGFVALLSVVVHFIFEDTGIWYVFCGLGGLAAGAILVDAVNRSRRQVVLTVAGGRLIVQQSNLYGVKRDQWPRLRIADVRVGDNLNGRASNSDPTYELQVQLRNGETVRFLDGYGDAELQWLATVLRRALRVPENSSTR